MGRTSIIRSDEMDALVKKLNTRNTRKKRRESLLKLSKYYQRNITMEEIVKWD